MQGSPFRVLIATVTALALTLGSFAGASAGGPPPDVDLELCEEQLFDGAAVGNVEFAFLQAGFDGDIFEIIDECEELGFDGVVTVVQSKIDFILVDFPVDEGGGGGGSVTVGGNGNSNNQNNDQDQDQTQEQGQDATQGNSNGASQGSTNAGDAGGSVDNGCDASQGEDDAGDDTVECTSGDAATGDSAVGDTNQANSGSQSGSNTTGQTGTQTGGSQANTPSNSTDQEVIADVSDIGGDDNDVDDDSINDNSGDIDQSGDDGVIEGDDNEIGGGEALSAFLTQLIALLISLFTPDEPAPLDPVITLTFTPNVPSGSQSGKSERAIVAPAFGEMASTAGAGASDRAMLGVVSGSRCTATVDLTGFAPGTSYALMVIVNGNFTSISVSTDMQGNADNVTVAELIGEGDTVLVSENTTGATTGLQTAPPACSGPA